MPVARDPPSVTATTPGIRANRLAIALTVISYHARTSRRDDLARGRQRGVDSAGQAVRHELRNATSRGVTDSGGEHAADN